MELLPTKQQPDTIDKIFEIDCVFPKEARQKSIDSALARNLPRCITRKRRPGKIAIVASGPSVTDCVDILKEWDGEIWGINGAFKWMLHRGIKPTAFVGLDPEEIIIDYLEDAPLDATYYLASQVHPKAFDLLKNHNVRIWFQGDTEVEHPPDCHMVMGGSTCLSRAPNLAYLLGWRDVHVMGGDSSYTHKTHVYGGDLPSNTIPVEINGRIFKTLKPMLGQATEFAEQMVEWARPPDPMSVSIYGDGLMQELVKQSLEGGGYEQYLYEQLAHRQNRKARRARR